MVIRPSTDPPRVAASLRPFLFLRARSPGLPQNHIGLSLSRESLSSFTIPRPSAEPCRCSTWMQDAPIQGNMQCASDRVIRLDEETLALFGQNPPPFPHELPHCS